MPTRANYKLAIIKSDGAGKEGVFELAAARWAGVEQVGDLHGSTEQPREEWTSKDLVRLSPRCAT